MQNANASDVIEKAIATVAEASREQTGGKWLEKPDCQCRSPHQGLGHRPVLGLV